MALYATIWLALGCFVVAQYGQRDSRLLPRWAPAANVLGLALCAIHIVIAIGSVHGWSHAAATEATARQTAAVYGLRWGGGVVVNYLFVAVWALDAWRRAHGRVDAPLVRVTLRAFYAIVIVNAAVVFARGPMRIVGLLLVAALLYAWRPRRPLKHASAAAL